jgi:transcriptional regulator with XRE-family HTH domain
MSSLFPDSLPRSPRAAFERQVWGEFFGDLIRSAREQRSRSIEEATGRAGMTAAEWEAMEAGRVPGTREQLQAIAASLEIEWDAMVSVALLCRQAWGR